MRSPSVSFRHVEMFRAVMLNGSVTRAAMALRTSQPTATRVLKEMEARVGFRLFQRSGRRMVPTVEARAFFKEVEASYVGLDRLARAAYNIATFRPGHLQIVSVSSVAIGLLPRAIARFRDRYGDVTIAVEINTYEGAIGRVIAGQCDLGFAVVPGERPEVRIAPLVTVDGVCVLPRGHPLEGKPVIHAADLAGQPFVSLGDQFPSRPRIDATFQRGGIDRGLVVETEAGSVAAAFVKEGVGVTVIDPFSARALADARSVVRPFRPAVPFVYSTITPFDQPKARLTGEFLAAVHELLEREADELLSCPPPGRDRAVSAPTARPRLLRSAGTTRGLR